MAKKSILKELAYVVLDEIVTGLEEKKKSREYPTSKTKQNLTNIAGQDEILSSLLKGDDQVGLFRKIGGKSLFTRCCESGMTKLKTYSREETPKGIVKESRTYDDIFYCHTCGSTYHPQYSD